VNRGYSLIELIVTIGIMAVLAAVAIPYFNQSDVDTTWFHEQVKAAVRYAQRQAVAQRRSVFVIVSANSVELCYDVGCAVRVPQITTGTAYILTAPSGITLGSTSFSFNGLGQPSPLAGVSFSVGPKSVIVTAETGHVQ
jgi:MSHA pilin protein MshC